MNHDQSAPDQPAAPVPAPVPRWVVRLQWFGWRAVTMVLLVMLALWLHELLYVDPLVRQAWKLKVLFVLAPLGAGGALALLVAAGADWLRCRRR